MQISGTRSEMTFKIKSAYYKELSKIWREGAELWGKMTLCVAAA